MQNKSHSQTITVEENQTAEHLGSGTLPVFATPALIALMENTAMKILADLPEGNTSVGTSIKINHLKACKIGAIINCLATLISIDGRKFLFEIIVKNSNGDIIGEGTHERVIVDIARFMNKIN